jgi:hypothetical protein
LGGFGLSLRPGSGQDFRRAETSALVQARNFARIASEQRRSDVLSGGLGGSAMTQRSTLSG